MKSSMQQNEIAGLNNLRAGTKSCFLGLIRSLDLDLS